RRPAGLRLAAGDPGADLLHRRHQRAAARGLLLLEPAVAAHRVHARAVPLRAGERLPALLRELRVRHGAHRARGGDRLAAGLLRDRALPHPPGALQPEAVPDGHRDPAAGHDHPRLLPDRAAGSVRHPVGELNNTHRPLHLNEFRAFTLVDEYATLIFINTLDSNNGKTFSLLHEVAHVFLGINSLYNDDFQQTEKDINTTEILCNKIAGELIAPTEIFINLWNLTYSDEKD